MAQQRNKAGGSLPPQPPGRAEATPEHGENRCPQSGEPTYTPEHGENRCPQSGEPVYAPEELAAAANAYFARCADEDRRPTHPGLCAHLGISPAGWTRLMEDDGTRRPLEQALLRMADALEQRTDSMAQFLLRQGCYGAYAEKKDAPAAPLTVTVTFGKTGRKAAERYGG